jgi:pimeloyl-ACP methyl ester carboxylesterase
MAANIFSPKAVTGKLPTIIMAYGWGGTMQRVREEAAAFAAAGYLVVTFDYRGWGESDSRVILAAAEPAERPSNRFTAEVVELREILDPLAEVTDLSNVVHWVQAETQSDTSRIGIWGTSFGGSIAAAVAGYDHRIRAVHAQVVPLELRVLDRAGYAEGTKRARGELGYRTRSKNTYKRWRLVKRVSRAASIRQDPRQLSRCLVSRLDPPLKDLKFESLPSTRSGTQRWSQTSTGCFAYALFYGVFGELFDGGRESLPLRHNKMGSRKPRQIRTSYTTGSAGVAPRVAPIMAR